VKLALFRTSEGAVAPGVLVPEGIVSAAPLVTHLGHANHRFLPWMIDNFDSLRDRLIAMCASEAPIALESVSLLPPLPRPRTILCAIANYWEHAQREPRPLWMYIKNPDAVIGPGDTIELPKTTDPWVFMHEAELAVVMKGPTRPLSPDSWRTAVFGYTSLIDVSARGEGRTSWGEFSWLGKSFDTFCPIGPCIVTADEIPEPNDLHVRLWNDDQLRHDYNTDDMEHRVPELVSWATRRVTLRSGDLIACGTNHEGLGPIQNGETLTLTIDEIGSLVVRVHDPLNRRWERGVYMGHDSTNLAAVERHRRAAAQHGNSDPESFAN
jgi:2-keto-4-pentenoate hydratase/2-oxohepta-3-ene-1,7-dioic acid hydratase in catechol pathway